MDKSKLNEDIAVLLANYLDRKVKEQAYQRFYSGKVEDNNDPEKMGRCRIRVYGIFGDDIPTDDLPWAVPDFNFIGSTIGSFIVPPINCIVKVYFDQKDIYMPKYTTKILDINNLSVEKDTDYPETMVMFETDSGEYFTINRKTYESYYHHSSGVSFSIDKDGVFIITTDDDKFLIQMNSGGTDFTLNDVNKNIIKTDNTGMSLTDKNGNTLVMASNGVKINGHYLVTKEYLDWLFNNSASFGLGNTGSPVPIFPAALTKFNTGNNTPDQFKTDK